jgi:peptide deformylase
MHDTLEKAQGVGLAAPQVGILRRIVIVEIDDKKYEMINPEIIETKGRQDEIEACLSVPDKYGLVRRPAKVKVRATDRNGNVYEVEGEGLMARCFCHELDHLDGILYIDKAKEIYDPEDIEDA